MRNTIKHQLFIENRVLAMKLHFKLSYYGWKDGTPHGRPPLATRWGLVFLFSQAALPASWMEDLSRWGLMTHGKELLVAIGHSTVCGSGYVETWTARACVEVTQPQVN